MDSKKSYHEEKSYSESKKIKDANVKKIIAIPKKVLPFTSNPLNRKLIRLSFPNHSDISLRDCFSTYNWMFNIIPVETFFVLAEKAQVESNYVDPRLIVR